MSRSLMTAAGCWHGGGCPRGLDGVTRLHALIGEHAPVEWADLERDRAAAMVKVETDRGHAASYLAASVGPLTRREFACTAADQGRSVIAVTSESTGDSTNS